jgi:hypothetical protein
MVDKRDELIALVDEQLKKQGIDLEELRKDCPSDTLVKIVCVAPDMKDSVRELSQGTRDQDVMVRIDEDTSNLLNDWVETGAVKSRSEGAALFIREGLKVRAQELAKLQGALEDVKTAKEKLRRQAKDVLEGNN